MREGFRIGKREGKIESGERRVLALEIKISQIMWVFVMSQKWP